MGERSLFETPKFVMPEYCIEYANASCNFVDEPEVRSERFARTITEYEPVSFQVRISNGASCIKVRFATWRRSNSVNIEIELFDDTKTLVLGNIIESRQIRDGEFVEVINLRRIDAPLIGNFTLRLKSPGASHENGFAVWLYAQSEGGSSTLKRIASLRNERFYLYCDEGKGTDLTQEARIALVIRGDVDQESLAAVDIVAKLVSPSRVVVVKFSTLDQIWEELRFATAVFFWYETPNFDEICFELLRLGVCTVFVDLSPFDNPDAKPSLLLQGDLLARDALRRRCRFTLTNSGNLIDNAPSDNQCADSRANLSWDNALSVASKRWMPPITLVLAVSASDDQTKKWLQSYASHPYPGALKIILVGALGADVNVYMRQLYSGPRSLIILPDGKAVMGSLLNEADDDGLILLARGGDWSESFLASHAFEHADGKDSLVVGCVIDSGATESQSIDDFQRISFLNCTSSNVSFPSRLCDRLRLLVESVGTAEQTTRLAYELRSSFNAYLQGVDFRISKTAILETALDSSSVQRPEYSAEYGDEIHPDLGLILRRSPFGRIFNAPAIRRKRCLNILTYRWHVPHQYELYKLPHQFHLVNGLGDSRFIDKWNFDQRPLPHNAKFVSADSLKLSDYDLAILHFDEHVMATYLSNGVLGPSWGDAFEWGLGLDLPKIGVCHGTPAFVGQFAARKGPIDNFKIHDNARGQLVKAAAAAELKVVCNSNQALLEWGFENARVIWHGFDPKEFPPSSYEKGVLVQASDLQRPHYRGTYEAKQVLSLLGNHVPVGNLRYVTPPLEKRETSAYGAKMFKSYIEATRCFSLILNTTRRSPMPRTRGEAMMMGVAPICLRNHDVDLFIENGVNGFSADDPVELADFLNFTFRSDDLPRKLGQAARLTALDLFNCDRYLESWNRLILDTI